jgi:hypothetical protein
MLRKGVEFTVVQTANPHGWKWSFQLEGRRPKTGPVPRCGYHLIGFHLGHQAA